MNTETTIPAYLVQVSYPVEPNRTKSYVFREEHLLNARQEALQKAQQVIAGKETHEVLDVTIDLVEIDRSKISDKHRLIARAFSQRFHRTMFISEGKDLLVDMQMDAFTKKSLPPALFLTIGLAKEYPPCNSPEIAAKNLADVAKELGYYEQHGHSINIPQSQQSTKNS